jgi:hypothetical protein
MHESFNGVAFSSCFFLLLLLFPEPVAGKAEEEKVQEAAEMVVPAAGQQEHAEQDVEEDARCSRRARLLHLTRTYTASCASLVPRLSQTPFHSLSFSLSLSLSLSMSLSPRLMSFFYFFVA